MQIEVKGGREDFPYSIRDVHISDPCIFPDEKTGMYYTYVQFVDRERFPDAAGDGMCFYVIKSTDLVNWSVQKVCFRQKDTDFWADKDYWAPELHLWKGKYYLFSTFRKTGTYRRCQCLVADSPEGPFKPMGGPVTPDGWQCLDGTLYVDKKGDPWMVFVHEWLQVYDGQIAAVPLSQDLSRAVGDPLILFRATDAPWVGTKHTSGGFVTDGPYLRRMQNGSLIMIWSSFSEDGAYTCGQAKSLSGEIFGPWVQDPVPVYGLDGAHAMLFETFGGQLMMSLHSPNEHPKKRILLFEMAEDGDRLRIECEVTGNWYSRHGKGSGARYASRDVLTESFYFAKDPRKKADCCEEKCEE